MTTNEQGRSAESRRSGPGLTRYLARSERGFTLIEILVVVVIIGVLIAIAIPLFLNQSKRSNDKAAQSDVRNFVSVLENCNSENAKYPITDFTGGSATAGTSTAPGTCTGQRLTSSKGTTYKYFVNVNGTAGTSYLIVGTNQAGSSNLYYCYSSVAGGSVKKLTADKTEYADAC